METIVPGNQITETDPVPQDALNALSWYYTRTTTVTDDALPWMLSQGYYVISSTPHYDFSGNLTHTLYSIRRDEYQAKLALQDLSDTFVEAYNNGREANETRYDDIVGLWEILISATQTDLEAMEDAFDVSSDNTDVAAFDTDYSTHAATIRATIDDLGTTELARINEKWDDALAQETKQLIDRGLYSSASLAAITARNTRERGEDIAAHNTRIAREEREAEERLYAARASSRQAKVQLRMATNERYQKLLELQVRTRNEFLVGLFGFMERRTDTYPNLASLAQLSASLGEYGSAAWQSVQ